MAMVTRQKVTRNPKTQKGVFVFIKKKKKNPELFLGYAYFLLV